MSEENINPEQAWRRMIYEELTAGLIELRAQQPKLAELIRFQVGVSQQPQAGYLEIITTHGGLVSLHRWLAAGLLSVAEPLALPPKTE